MTKKPKQSSALPWTHTPAEDEHGKPYSSADLIDSNNESVFRLELEEFAGLDDVNAALIVRRVNQGPAFDAMVDALAKAEQALKDIMGAADNGEPYTSAELEKEFMDDYRAVYAALKLAREKK